MQTHKTTSVDIQQPSQPQFVTVSNDERVLSNSRLKKTCVIQIVLGIIGGQLSIIAIILEASSSDKDRYTCVGYYNSTRYYYLCGANYIAMVFAFQLPSLISFGWFVLTGFIAMSMSTCKNRKCSWRCLVMLKITFIVCSIIGVAVLFPTAFSLNAYWFLSGGNYTYAVLSIIIAVVSGVELVVAIVAVSFCCCCKITDTIPQQSFMTIDLRPQPSHIDAVHSGHMQEANMQPYGTTVGSYNHTQQCQNSQASSDQQLLIPSIHQE